jgi:hypothetical protein
MERVVQPELLDELPARDPRAARSRRDLRRLNMLMGHHRIMANALGLVSKGWHASDYGQPPAATPSPRPGGARAGARGFELETNSLLTPAQRKIIFHRGFARSSPREGEGENQALSGKTRPYGHELFRISELGAGGGEFLLSVARRLNGRWQNVEATLVDRANVFDSQTRGEFGALGWRTNVEVQDALSWLRHSQAGKCDVLVTNLFLHQCPDQDLAEMFSLAANLAKILIAVEPRRGFWPLLCSRFVGLAGCGAVTRYDAPVSVRAGFRDCELSTLWPDKKNWDLTERRAGLFSHLFIARWKR